MVERLKPFAGTKFDIGHSKYGREEWDFLWLFEPLPAAAGWLFLDWVPGSLPHPGVFRKVNWTMKPHVYGTANVSNVVIELSPENRKKLLPAATALAEALSAVGIDAGIGADQPINWVSTTADAIHILVGPKE
jgi:hypothetical protein